MSKKGIAIKLTAETASAARGIKDIDDKLGHLGQQASETVNKLKTFATLGGALTIAIGAVKGLTGASKELVETFKVQEQAEAKLEAALKATGQYTPRYTREMKNLASSMQLVTTYGDETVLGVEQLYIATKKIGSDVMPRATMAALDMAAALGEDLVGAAKRLSKVLADPTQGLDALKDANVVLTRAQVEQIGAMAKQGNLLEAQSAILDAVESAYAGTAKAIADMDTAKLTQIGNVYGDIKEGLGSALLNSISPALHDLYGQLLQISEWVNRYATKVSAYDAASDGITLEGYTEQALNDALGTAHKALAHYGRYSGPGEAAQRVVDAVTAEIARRAVPDGDFLMFEAHPHITPKGGGSSSSPSSTGTSTEAAKSFLDIYGRYSKAYQAADLQKAIELGEKELALYEKGTPEYIQASEAIEALRLQKEALYKVEEKIVEIAPEKTLKDFLDGHASMSEGMQLKAVTAQIQEAKDWLSGVDADSSEAAYLTQIIRSLEEQLRIMTGVKTEAELVAEATEAQSKAAEKAAQAAARYRREIAESVTLWSNAAGDVVSAGFGLADQLMQNELDALDKQLSQAEEKYQKYFDSVNGLYAAQGETLDRYYANGEMSEEEYMAAKEKLEADQVSAMEEAEKEKEEIAKKADAIKRSQFESDKANAIVQATISSAQAIAQIWAQHGANPITAGVLTGLATLAVGTQIANIAAQQYQPMATGGITTGPTKALIGEAGREAIIPLDEWSMERNGLFSHGDEQKKQPEVHFHIENVWGMDDMVSLFKDRIEKGQRQGVISPWRYAE